VNAADLIGWLRVFLSPEEALAICAAGAAVLCGVVYLVRGVLSIRFPSGKRIRSF
jgi:fucose permease